LFKAKADVAPTSRARTASGVFMLAFKTGQKGGGCKANPPFSP
jgi:hypothetical protein